MARSNLTAPRSASSGFGIYLRISKEGARTQKEVDEQLGLYERACRGLADRKGVEVVTVVAETDVSGGKAVADRGLDGLIKQVEAGKLAGIIVPDSERFARDMIEGCIALKRIRDAGGRFLSDDGIDSAEPSSTEFFQMRMLFAESYLRKVTARFSERVAESISKGIHAGSVAPFGYDWPKTIIDLGDGRTKFKKEGPLQPTADAPAVGAVFEAYGAEDVRERITACEGARRLGVTVNRFLPMLSNRVYLGEARSVGAKQNYVKENAHPALISVECFDRIQARLGAQAVEYHSRGRRAPNTLRPLSKVVRCGVSGLVMSFDSNGAWRCKAGSRGECSCGAQSIMDSVILPWALREAQLWHAEFHALWALGRAADNATRSVLEAAALEAEAVVLARESENECELPANSKPKRDLAEALAALREHEASFGWIAQSPEAVAEMIESGNVEALNSFVRETLTVSVSKAGMHAVKAARTAEARCKAVFLKAGRTFKDSTPETFEGKPAVLAQAVQDSAGDPVVSAVEGAAVEAALARVRAS